ncbi:hypothetical protein B0T26DRAFT_801940 [Lasiosphaeria miniovina]|uniref:Uncharacterized protein n=1 Tax=Lasiosphaeria miniovina TaxID=1954250 RepID=A0AA40E465_9PEZI|nr:uncharacterized protein B0T26DRAFT_801940 [Lasiosphaeria miniovina]KAK0723396.1 hypothetical protein B0T26DRAFT_801940 [Lasiosphaeria miniovina]
MSGEKRPELTDEHIATTIPRTPEEAAIAAQLARSEIDYDQPALEALVPPREKASSARKIAEFYGRRTTGPAFQFRPMADKGINAFLDYDGPCLRDDFARLVKANEEAVYHEFKFRAILMAALRVPSSDLLIVASRLNANQ